MSPRTPTPFFPNCFVIAPAPLTASRTYPTSWTIATTPPPVFEAWSSTLSRSATRTRTVAFMGRRSGFELECPPWERREERSQNEQISSTGLYNGRTRAFLLAPVKRAPAVPAPADLSGARSLRRCFFGGREVRTLEDGGGHRPPAEHGAELLSVRDRTMLGPKPDDRFDLALAEADQLKQLASIGQVDPDPVRHGDLLGTRSIGRMAAASAVDRSICSGQASRADTEPSPSVRPV